MKDRYLILLGNNIVIDGESDCAIYSLSAGTVHVIPNALASIIKELENYPVDFVSEQYADQADIFNSYVDYIVSNRLGFFTDTPELFPKISLNFHKPELISSCIVQYSENYCFENLANELDSLNCKVLELQLANEIDDLNALEKILGYLVCSTIRCINIYIDHFDFENARLQDIILKNKKINAMTFTKSEKFSKTRFDNCKINYVPFSFEELRNKYQVENKLIINNLYFLESLYFNPRYSFSVSIDRLGNILNHLEEPEIFGNLNKNGLKKVVIDEQFQKKWKNDQNNSLPWHKSPLRYCIYNPTILPNLEQIKKEQEASNVA